MDFELAEGIAVLERTPAVSRTLLSGLPEAWTHPGEGPDTWSPFDNVGHLIDGEEKDWMVRARIIVSQGLDRRFEPFHRLGHRRVTGRRTLGELLDRFAKLRAENREDLKATKLGPEQSRLTGEHPESGVVTLEQLLATWVAHDLGHDAQVARAMARQYREAVEPWEAYPDEDRRGGFAHRAWAVPYAAMARAADAFAKAGALLLGRRTYEDFYDVWPERTENPFTPWLNAVRKYVLMRAGVVDEWVLLIHPLVLRCGTVTPRRWAALSALHLVGSRSTANGVVLSTYRAARHVP